jgi:hypothetical protein
MTNPAPFWNSPEALEDHEGEMFLGTLRCDTVGEYPREDIYVNVNGEGGNPELVRRFGDEAPMNSGMPISMQNTACLSPAWHRAFALWGEMKGEYMRLRQVAGETAAGRGLLGFQTDELAEDIFQLLLNERRRA